MVVLGCACSERTSDYYILEGGDRRVDWIEFAGDSTLRWVGPGAIPETSSFVENEDGDITVFVAPFSCGRLHRIDNRTLIGEAPFFEGIWKKTRQ